LEALGFQGVMIVVLGAAEGWSEFWYNKRSRLEALGFRGVVVVVVLGEKEGFFIRIEVKPSAKATTLAVGWAGSACPTKPMAFSGSQVGAVLYSQQGDIKGRKSVWIIVA